MTLCSNNVVTDSLDAILRYVINEKPNPIQMNNLNPGLSDLKIVVCTMRVNIIIAALVFSDDHQV